MRKLHSLLFFLCVAHSFSSIGQSHSNYNRSSFWKENKLAISANAGYSTRTIDNSKTYLNTLRNGTEAIHYNGYKMGLQVSLTSTDDDFILNKLNSGIRGDYYNMNAKSSHRFSENISLYYIGIVQGGSYAITKSANVSLKLDLSIGYAQFKNELHVNTQKNELSGSGFGYGASLSVSFELSKHLYLNIGGDILISIINSKIKATPNIVYSRGSEGVSFTTALFSVTRQF
ncbi:MAG: hypothetical protein JWP81_3018 [Ferruginibacter sp.]|nr:hypothetical protein [Ferruginibacter sp.]